VCTHSYNNEVEPAPGVREILAEPVGADLDQHLQHEYDRKHFVEHVQYRFEDSSLFQLNVHIFSRLQQYVTGSAYQRLGWGGG